MAKISCRIYKNTKSFETLLTLLIRNTQLRFELGTQLT